MYVHMCVEYDNARRGTTFISLNFMFGAFPHVKILKKETFSGGRKNVINLQMGFERVTLT